MFISHPFFTKIHKSKIGGSHSSHALPPTTKTEYNVDLYICFLIPWITKTYVHDETILSSSKFSCLKIGQLYCLIVNCDLNHMQF